MFRHDAAHTGVSGSTAPTKMYALWRFETGAPVFSSPAVVGGKVYVGSNDGNLYCLDGTTGEKAWQYTTGDDVQTSPAVIGDKVYFGSCDYYVYCVSTSGSLVWRYLTGSWVYSSPTVDNGRVYIASMDKSMYCLNATDGSLIWKRTYPEVFYTVSASITNGRCIFGNDDRYVHCVNATTGVDIWNYQSTSSIGASSAAVADGRVFIGSDDNNFYVINETTGKLIYKYNTPTNILQDYVRTSAALYDGKAYLGFAHQFTVLDQATGSVNATLGGWTFHTGNIEYSSPAIGSNGILCFGVNDLNVYLFDAETGQRLQSYWTSATVQSLPAIAYGKIYIGDGNDFVYCFAQVSGTSVPTSITLNATATVDYGRQVFVTGRLNPGVTGVNVNLVYTKPDGTTMEKFVFAKADGTFIDAETVDQVGAWTVQASFNAYDIWDASQSAAVSFEGTGTAPTAELSASAITCSATLTSSGDISIKGAIMPAVSGATVTLTIWKPDATSITRSVTSAADGSYSDTYVPDMVGNYLVKASWAGDSTYKAAASAIVTAPSTSTSAGAASSTGVSIDWIYAIIALIVIVLIVVIILAILAMRKK